MSFSFQIINVTISQNLFHHELLFLKNMLMELCASNYATLNGIVNGADGTFQDYT
jgi:hypothetical protein